VSTELFVDIFDGIWTALDGDPTVTSLMGNGTKFKWVGGLLHRLDIVPAMCPLLSLGPAGDLGLPYDYHEGPPALPFSCEIAVDSRDCRVGLRLLVAVFRCLVTEAREGNRFGVPTLDHLTFSAARMELFRAAEAAVPLWVARFTVTAHYRVNTEIT
jgi:hypothetical protein